MPQRGDARVPIGAEKPSVTTERHKNRDRLLHYEGVRELQQQHLDDLCEPRLLNNLVVPHAARVRREQTPGLHGCGLAHSQLRREHEVCPAPLLRSLKNYVRAQSPCQTLRYPGKAGAKRATYLQPHRPLRAAIHPERPFVHS